MPSSSISSFLYIENNFLLIGASNSVIYLYHGDFSSNDSLSVATITFHSNSIIALDGSPANNLIVSIDSQHHVFYSSFFEKKFIYTFKLDCDEKAEHLVKIGRGGLIFVSSSFSFSLEIFDLTGVKLSFFEFNSKIIRIENFFSQKHGEIGVVSMEEGTFNFYALTRFQKSVIPKGSLDPRFFFAFEADCKLIAKELSSNRIKVLKFGFNKLEEKTSHTKIDTLRLINDS